MWSDRNQPLFWGNLEVRHSLYVLNHDIESEREKNSHKHKCIWYLTSSDGG